MLGIVPEILVTEEGDVELLVRGEGAQEAGAIIDFELGREIIEAIAAPTGLSLGNFWCPKVRAEDFE